MAANWPMPRENVYTCSTCHGYTTTVDVDHGVTPFIIDCRASGNVGDCDGKAYSSCYPYSLRPPHIPAPAWEWYRPDELEYNKLDRNMKEHVRQGGLVIRKRTKRLPIMHSNVDVK